MKEVYPQSRSQRSRGCSHISLTCHLSFDFFVDDTATKSSKLDTDFCILLFSLAGGLISFNIRYSELEKFRPKKKELEKEGNWENVVKETLHQLV